MYAHNYPFEFNHVLFEMVKSPGLQVKKGFINLEWMNNDIVSTNEPHGNQMYSARPLNTLT